MDKKKSPHEGHRERFRAKYLANGLDGFHDHEVLEFLLYYCYPRGDTNARAHKMLEEFGTLHSLLGADVDTLMEKLNCTENVAVMLNMIPAVANRCFRSKWGKKTVLDNLVSAINFSFDLFFGLTREQFYVLSLDNQLKLKKITQISKGTVDETAVYPREIVKLALHENITKLIIAHNHPGGTMKPSRADMEVTRRIVDGLELIRVDVVDHIIIAGDTYYSFASRGQLVTGY